MVSESLLTNDLIDFLSARLILIRTNSIRCDMSSADLTERLVQKNEYIQDLVKLVEASKYYWGLLHKMSNLESIFEILMQAIQTSWKYKSKWGDHILSSEVESIIKSIEGLGDIAYKLVGAGGGGFLLIAAVPEVILKIKSNFPPKDCINFTLYDRGTTTVTNV